MADLTEAEAAALAVLYGKFGGTMLTSDVPERTERGVFGQIVPGLAIYRKLEQKGLVEFTEAETSGASGDASEGFVFTNEVRLTEAGRKHYEASR